VADHHVRLDSFGDVEGSGGQTGAVLSAVELLVVAAIVAIWLSLVAHQVLGWRRSTGERRQQQKWLASGAAITIVGCAPTWRGGESRPGTDPRVGVEQPA
jgi:hypothetical protein